MNKTLKAVLLALATYLAVVIAVIVVNSILAATYRSGSEYAGSRTLAEMSYLGRLLIHLVPGLVLGYFIQTRAALWGLILGVAFSVPPALLSRPNPYFGHFATPIFLQATYVVVTVLAAVAMCLRRRVAAKT